MLDSDHDILQTALNWLNQDHNVTLITVLKTWGSSPRPAGSLMIIRNDGEFAGSVSGGCVEDDLLHRAKLNQLSNNATQTQATTLTYGGDSENTRTELPCGGRLELLIEQLENRLQLETILNNINKGQLISRRVCLNTGEISLHPVTNTKDFNYHEGDFIHKTFGSRWHLLLIGAGHLSQYVTQIAQLLNYKISVCDPRKDYQTSWPLKEILILKTMPDDAVKNINNPQRTIVLALSHDPKLDDMALLEALTINCFYVGALGSKNSSNKRRQRLAELELSPQQINQLHAPVGMDIGSHTPAEIAVSIMAEITKKRNLPEEIIKNNITAT